ncbi:MAG TPA: ATP-binding protein [bacterium]|nr:ATP-binding protein [bacterium]
MQHSSLFTRSVDGILMVSATGQVEDVNAAGEAILAARADALRGTDVSRWIPGIKISAGQTHDTMETTLVSAQADRFPAEVCVFPADEGASPSGRTWVVFRDISIRKGLEGSVRAHAGDLEKMVETRTRELDELHRRHCRLYHQVPVLDFELDSQHSVASANRKACVSLGVTTDRLVGLPLVELAVPDRREDLTRALEVMNGGSIAPFETRLRSADGSVLDVVLHACKGDDHSRSGLRIVGLDVTARREAERLVDQSLDLAEAQRARMERILRGIGEGVVVTDPDGQVRLMNSIAERFLDIDERFAFGRDLFAEQRDLEFSRAWTDFTLGEDDLAQAELTVGNASPQVYTVSMSRIRTPEGRPAGCVAVLHDVTRERELDQMKTDFVSNLTHELRTPLASIRGFTATILRGRNVEEGDRVRFLEIVEREAERLQQLIEDLLALSRLEAGREVLSLRAANFVDLMHACRESMAAMARRKRLAIEVEGTDANSSGVFDGQKMRRVLDNLVGNALKFTPEGGRVSMRFSRQGDRLECRVADNGPGADKEALSHMFDRFYTSNPQGGNPQGTGLGLHIVKRLIELHGGGIEVSSQPGEGTTFRFWIPGVPRKITADEPAGDRPADPLEDLADDDAPLVARGDLPGENGTPAG